MGRMKIEIYLKKETKIEDMKKKWFSKDFSDMIDDLKITEEKEIEL